MGFWTLVKLVEVAKTFCRGLPDFRPQPIDGGDLVRANLERPGLADPQVAAGSSALFLEVQAD